MSHVDRGQYSGTCQTCREPKRCSSTGIMRRHKTKAGHDCPGGRCLSVEAANPMTDEQAQAELVEMYRAAGWTDEELRAKGWL